jgi:hypothetical protein
MIDLIRPTEYYKKINIDAPLAQKFFEPGQFFMSPSLFLIEDNPLLELKPKYNKATLTYQYNISRASRAEFDETREPCYDLKLRAKERALIVPGKMRPVVLISQYPEQWKYGVRQSSSCFLVAPIYSFEGDDGKTAYPPEFIERVKAYVYNTFFYLPTSTSPFFKEGFARFDRIQAIHKNWLQHMRIKLESDPLECMLSWLWYYLGADLYKTHSLLFEYREAKMKAMGLPIS